MSPLRTLKDINSSWEGHDRDFKQKLRYEAIKKIKSNNTGGFSFKIGFDGKVISYQAKKKKLLTIDYVNLGSMIDFIDVFSEKLDLK